jgi:hypothetical protein
MSRALLVIAREVIENLIHRNSKFDIDNEKKTISMIHDELEKPWAEPVGAVVESGGILATVSASGYGGRSIPVGTKLYAHPPKREPLSDDEVWAEHDSIGLASFSDGVRFAEKVHGIEQ